AELFLRIRGDAESGDIVVDAHPLMILGEFEHSRLRCVFSAHRNDVDAQPRHTTGLLPPPLAGEGWGGGKRSSRRLLRPLPVPPAQAGEGTLLPCPSYLTTHRSQHVGILLI